MSASKKKKITGTRVSNNYKIQDKKCEELLGALLVKCKTMNSNLGWTEKRTNILSCKNKFQENIWV